jgi:hypothetical protein
MEGIYDGGWCWTFLKFILIFYFIRYFCCGWVLDMYRRFRRQARLNVIHEKQLV